MVTVVSKTGEVVDQFDVRQGANLWVFLRKEGHPIGSACSGVGVCGACHVVVVDGSPECLSPQNDFERETLRRNNRPAEERLACLCRVQGDVTIKTEYW